MTFLSPWTAIFAAAITVPLLLLLYFLRLRRQHVRIPSTLLWQKSFEDLQVNAPFQRLRWSLLLLLQLLLLLSLLAALADPVLRGESSVASRIVVLIDRSASMNALVHDAGNRAMSNSSTRLDVAKNTARRMISRLGETGEPAEMMIIAFGSSAQVVSSFESNPSALQDALNSIQPTDEQADLDAALQLAAAFAGTSDENAEQQPDVVLFSDGGVGSAGDSSGYTLSAGHFRFVQVCPNAQDESDANKASMVDNIGIASFSIRRDYEDPAKVLVFARLVNAGPQPIPTVATLLVDGQPAASIRKTVPPAGESGPGEASISQTLELPGGAALTLRQNHEDDLASDNTAAIVLPPPAQPRIALVHPDALPADQFIQELIQSLEPQLLQSISESAYAALDAGQLDSGALFELIVFDRVSAARLPGVPTLTIGGTPAPLKAVAPADESQSESAGQHILSWDRQHPVMRNVSLDTVVYAGFRAYELPATTTSLALGSKGPVMAVLKTRNARHVAVGFEMMKSNWPLHISSSIFMQNVLDFLTLAESGQNGLAYRPGQSITVRAASEARELTIDGPATMTMAVEPGASVTLPILRRAGMYKVTGAASPNDVIAVSVLSDVESDIRPRDRIKVNDDTTIGHRAAAVAPQPLWPWLIAAAFVLLVIEWLVYCRRVRG